MQILIVLAGLALVFLTEYDTFGWIVFGIGLALFILPFLFAGYVFRKVGQTDHFNTFTHSTSRHRRPRR